MSMTDDLPVTFTTKTIEVPEGARCISIPDMEPYYQRAVASWRMRAERAERALAKIERKKARKRAKKAAA